MSPGATRVAAETLRRLPRERLSRALGRVAAAPAARPLLRGAIGVYVSFYGVDLSEAEVPAGGYRTFDEFFTRRLRPGVRPVLGDEGRVLSSPADGTITACGTVAAGATFEVKGRPYAVEELLGDGGEGYAGGTFAVVYLSPGDYHRVHAPVSGTVHTVRHVGGTLFPVNRLGQAAAPDVLVRNERVAVFQRAGALGDVATVLVGALAVGRIGLAFEPGFETNVGRAPSPRRYLDGAAAPALERGEPLGVFHLGSSVLVLAPRGAGLALRVAPGDRARVGEVLAEREAS